MRFKRFRPTPSMVVAMLALAVAIGGTAVAATKIGTKQIKNNAVTTKKIKKKAITTNRIKAKAVTGGKLAASSVGGGKIAAGAVNGGKIAAGAVDGSKIADSSVTGPKIAANAVDGSKVADDSLDDSKISDYTVFGDPFVKVTATDGADADAARTAAPETPLLSKGSLELYAKCFRDVGTNTVFGAIYVRTTTDFSIMEGNDDLPGGPLATDYLNISTLEVDRELDDQSVGANDASYGEAEGLAAATDGPALTALTGIGVKNGAVAANGPYGPGNACIFQGSAAG